MRVGDLAIEVFRKGFEVHVGSIHVHIKVASRFRQNVARSYCHALDANRSTSFGGVNGVFSPYDGIVVSEGNAFAAEFPGRSCDQFWLCH